MSERNGAHGEPRETAQTGARGGVAARVGKDMGPRIASALVLATVALAAIWYGSLPFSVLLTLVGGIVAWEWGRIVRGTEVDAAMSAHVAAVLSGLVLTSVGLTGPAILGVLIGTILTGLLSFGRHAGLSAIGVLCAGLPGIALLWLRSDEPYGMAAVFFVVLSVVAVDVGAYFCGRLIGGPKLWPRVSPNKTWAGLIGGVACAAVVGVGFAGFITGASSVKLGALSALLAIFAQGGDLAESALKRRFGTKDASNLIPGHGGFMDRMDGLAAASMVAALWAAALDMTNPARALLTL